MKILPVFEQYLRYGYFPYFLEHPEEYTYFCTLEQGLHTTIESDLPDSYLAVDGIEHGMGARIPLWLFGFLY